MPRRRAADALLLAAALVLPAGAASAAREPALRVYGMQDGLKFSQVFTVFQDRLGFVWAGTSYGVGRWDGKAFANLTKAQGLPHDSVRTFVQEAGDRIWVLTQEGVAAVEPLGGPLGEPRVVPLPAVARMLGTGHFHEMAGRDGTIWLLGEAGLHRYRAPGAPGGGGKGREEGLHLTFLPAGLESTEAVSLGPVSPEEAWVVWPRTVARVSSGGVRELPVPPALGEGVALARSGKDLLLLGKRGVAALVGERFEERPGWRLPPGCNPTGLTALPDGSLAVPTPARGVLVLAEGRDPVAWGQAQGLPTDEVFEALVDRDGLLWLATDNGLVKVFDPAVGSHRSGTGLGAMVLAFAQDEAGGTWVGHSGGASLLAGGNLRLLDPRRRADEEAGVWALLPLAGGGTLAGTRRGLVRLAGGVATRYPELPLAGADRVFSLVRAADGRVWASTPAGVVRFRWDDGERKPRDAHAFTTVGDTPLGEARGLAASPTGSVFVGTDGAYVVEWNGARLVRHGKETGLPSAVCRAVLVRPEGVLVGTDIGLYLLAGGRARPVTAVNRELPDPYIVSLASGQDRAADTFWVAGPDRVVEVKGGRAVWTIDRAHGLVGASTTSENGLAATADGRLLVGMVGGFSEIDLERRRRSWPVPAAVVLGAVDRTGRPVAFGAKVPFAANALTFAFRSPTFVAEEENLFEERLSGYEEAWQPATRRFEQRYTNLRPGRYAFEVRARSGRESAPGPAASFAFSVLPAFWQTVPFRAAAVLGLAAALLGLHRLRTRAIRRRAEELGVRVAERTRDLAAANRKLAEAQTRIEKLLETSPRAEEDLGAWADGAAREIARTVGARAIEAYSLERGRVVPLSRVSSRPPSEADVRAAPDRPPAGPPPERVLLRLSGATGETLGALALLGSRGPLAEAEGRLLAGFAHQLGGALEMRAVRKRLAAAEASHEVVRRDLAEGGVALVSTCPSCRRCFPAGAGKRCPDDGWALEATGILPLRVRDRYRLSRVLGQGGMATVFLAVDERLGREVAVKVIRPDLFDEPGVRLRFEREAQVVARIQHPGVIAVFDSGELPDGSLFLIMERLLGVDLAAALASWGRGRPAQVAALLRQAASALEAAHAAGVLHRDIKPGNLFLSGTPVGLGAKVVDFGLAKTLGGGTALTISGMVMGTPSYMSPEQVRGSPLTPRSDLYSLAATGYEALTGAKVVRSAVVGEVFSEILNERPAPPSSRRPGLPREVDEAFARALSKEALDRPAGVEEWVASFSAALEAVPPAEDGWFATPPSGLRSPVLDTLPAS